MGGFTVCQINVCWEANNFNSGALPEWTLHNDVDTKRQFSLVKTAYKPQNHGPFSTPLQLVIQKIQRKNTDIVCIQEFQIYIKTILGITRTSIEWLLEMLGGVYEACAVQQTSMRTIDTQIASVVLVKKALILGPYIQLDLQKDLSTVSGAFSRGRAVAGAIVKMQVSPGKVRDVLIISSHSGHHKRWDYDMTENHINKLAEICSRIGKQPRLIWGGDFNAEIKWKTPHRKYHAIRFFGKKVFKYPSSQYPSTTTFGNNGNGVKYDWILCTSETDTNPYITGIVDVPSDHKIVVMKTTARFIDRC